MKELNVIGTMQLLAACQKAPGLQHLVVKSTSTVYGASSRDPAMFTEDMEPRRAPRSGYAKDVAEIEGYVRGFARRRPDVLVTTLRLANVLGPHVTSPMTSLLPAAGRSRPCSASTPACSSCTRHDLLRVLAHAVHAEVPGTFNVAGDGVMLLSQAVRRLRKPDRRPAAARRRRPGVGAAVGADGRLLARAAQLPHLRSRHRHHPDAHRARLRAGAAPPPRRSPTSPTSIGHPPRPAERVVDGLAAAAARARPAHREPAVGDAEIIPIGTGGRPGRGSGSARPSHASRGLAGDAGRRGPEGRPRREAGAARGRRAPTRPPRSP